MWVFGYGSLIWHPGFTFESSYDGYLKGWSRYFYQGSTDHRGTPDLPGRVVTLVQEPGAVVWGRAYQVCGHERDAILAQLDHREKDGYTRHEVEVWRGQAVVACAVVWVAGPSNANYLGEAPVDAMADHVVRAAGPSGTNAEYVLNLDRSLRQMGVHDQHVVELANYVRSHPLWKSR